MPCFVQIIRIIQTSTAAIHMIFFVVLTGSALTLCSNAGTDFITLEGKKYFFQHNTCYEECKKSENIVSTKFASLHDGMA